MSDSFAILIRSASNGDLDWYVDGSGRIITGNYYAVRAQALRFLYGWGGSGRQAFIVFLPDNKIVEQLDYHDAENNRRLLEGSVNEYILSEGE